MLAQRTEAEFQRDVLRTAAELGWGLRYHTQFSVGSRKGFPDLVLVRARDRRVVFMELKGPKTAVQPEQVQWREGLQAAGAEAYLFRPCDEDRVRAVLA